jgi:uncharacterized metal-binding protein YceD (DUF177 family)
VDTKSKEKALAKFEISIINLLNKQYEYDFDCNEVFFQCFENELFTTGNCKVHVQLDKSSTMITAYFSVTGYVELVCDRSLDNFNYEIDFSERIFFKFGEKAQELSEDVVIIPSNTASINLSDVIFELIGLQIPMKKLHPRYQDEEEEENEDDILIYSSPEEETEVKNEEIDPRWADLQKLLKK